jgi:lipid A 3-O-deacylase
MKGDAPPMPPMKMLTLAAAILLPAAANAELQPDPATIITLQGENATITTSPNVTDRLYTNGLRLGWTSPTGQVPDFLASFGHALWGNGQQRISIDLSQQIYTPVDTNAVPANPHDRPYAGYLSANFSLLSDTEDHRSVLMLSLGVVGPASGGEALQNGFHDLIGQGHDSGWGSQIGNVPAIEVLAERTWRIPIGSIGGLDSDFLPALTVGLGDVRDYVQAGATVRIGQGLGSDFGVPRIRPGLSGGDAYTPARPVAWYLFAGLDGQAVAYDLLLQSTPFRSGPHVGALWDVGEFQAGAAIMAYGMRLTVAYLIQTPEFQGQRGGLHQMGSASIATRF